MFRLRFTLPKGIWSPYRNLDLIHDALINAWTAAGATADQVLGPQALPWTFAPLGYHRGRDGQVHSLVIATPAAELGGFLHQSCRSG